MSQKPTAEDLAVDLEEMVSLFSSYAFDFFTDEEAELIHDGWVESFEGQCKIPLRPLYKQLEDAEDRLRRIAEVYHQKWSESHKAKIMYGIATGKDGE